MLQIFNAITNYNLREFAIWKKNNSLKAEKNVKLTKTCVLKSVLGMKSDCSLILTGSVSVINSLVVLPWFSYPVELNYLYSLDLPLFWPSISSIIEILSKVSEKKDYTIDKKSQMRIKHNDDGDLNYLEMMLVADNYTIAFHGNTTTKYLLMLANLVS